MKLEDLKPGMNIAGLKYDQTVTIVQVKEIRDSDGTLQAALVAWRSEDGSTGEELLYPSSLRKLSIESGEERFDFGADGSAMRLAAEAWRMIGAHVHDRHMAVHSSHIEPLPHQLIAVYDIMLNRQPLRFLLADDPGAGKTIMTGLLVRELIANGEVERCLICVPGGLVEQWRDEMEEKFDLEFEIMERDVRTGIRDLRRHDLLIGRLDQLKREEYRESVAQNSWDLIVCDEAHKMSASWAGKSVDRTRRYLLGQLLGRQTRNFLLLTATPHNGIEVDFQLFLCLLDSDRFHLHSKTQSLPVHPADLMRRLQKERLQTMDGQPLFPARHARTLEYRLARLERELYEEVTTYVREEFDRASQLSGGRRNSVGFALTILQRRLASSPQAIWHSLQRRRARLQERLDALRSGPGPALRSGLETGFDSLDDEEFDIVEEGRHSDELESISDEVLERSTAAATLEELEKEINTLNRLESLAQNLHASGEDRKWQELAALFDAEELLRHDDGSLRKLIIFTEHRDTLAYLCQRLQDLRGRTGSVVSMHGGTPHNRRSDIQRSFQTDPNVTVLVATDAAGEGINLHSAHLMVNYDLPWNPNRLEQRFGRIHRIGQKHECHLWNLVTRDTREGEVYKRLLEKMNVANRALNDTVFDVLGSSMSGKTLRDLMIEAVREGHRPDAMQRIDRKLEEEHRQLQERVRRQSWLADDLLDADVSRARDELEQQGLHRLQPHHISAFCKEALERFDGSLMPRGPGQFRIGRVPGRVRIYARQNGLPTLDNRYERVCFDKASAPAGGSKPATLLYPGHPLLRALAGKLWEECGTSLSRGAVLEDDRPDSTVRVLLLVELEVRNDLNRQGESGRVAREACCLELTPDAIGRAANAPWLDLEPAGQAGIERARDLMQQDWLQADSLLNRAQGYAITTIIPAMLARCQPGVERERRKLEETRARLVPAIMEEDGKVSDFRTKEREGTTRERNLALANRLRAEEQRDNLEQRLQLREEETHRRTHLRPQPPRIVGGALVIPALAPDKGEDPPDPEQRRRVEKIAMDAIMDHERSLGHVPRDVSSENLGYDVASQVADGPARYIEVKGRRAGAGTVSLSRNEMITAKNSGDNFFLAVVEVEGEKVSHMEYFSASLLKEDTDNLTASFNLSLKDLRDRRD